jgi:hypothetical protein
MYGHKEHLYCEPVAEALASDMAFARFFIERAKVTDWDEDFFCLKSEQLRLRSKALFWWKNVFCSEYSCQCSNLKGTEVDIHVVFEQSDGKRLGLHIECKNPDDRFHSGQSARYRERLSCWGQPERGPKTIPRYDKAASILICERNNSHNPTDLAEFDGVIFFDEIQKWIPEYPSVAV